MKDVSAMTEIPGDLKVTVCDKCFRVCCWHGIFMCDEAYSAGTKDIPVSEWRTIMKDHANSEHEDYLEHDYNVREWRESIGEKAYDG